MANGKKLFANRKHKSLKHHTSDDKRFNLLHTTQMYFAEQGSTCIKGTPIVVSSSKRDEIKVRCSCCVKIIKPSALNGDLTEAVDIYCEFIDTHTIDT